MLSDFPAIWEAAKPAERHQLLRATFTAVYCDPAEGVLVGGKPRAAESAGPTAFRCGLGEKREGRGCSTTTGTETLLRAVRRVSR